LASERIKLVEPLSDKDVKPILIVRNGYNIKLSFSPDDNAGVIEKVKDMLAGTYKIAIYQGLDRE